MSHPTGKTLDVRAQEISEAITPQFQRSDLVVVDNNPYRHGYVIDQANDLVRVRMNNGDEVKTFAASRLTEAHMWMSQRNSVKDYWQAGA